MNKKRLNTTKNKTEFTQSITMSDYLLSKLSKRASLLDTREPIKTGAKIANKTTTKKMSVINSYAT